MGRKYAIRDQGVAVFVESGYDWLWSSCADYEKGIKGKIEITYLE